MKKLYTAFLIILSFGSFAINLDDYSAVKCTLPSFNDLTLQFPLEFDPNAGVGQEFFSKVGETNFSFTSGTRITISASVTKRPLFYIKIKVNRSVEEVEVLADHITGINIMGGKTNARGYCSFEK